MAGGSGSVWCERFGSFTCAAETVPLSLPAAAGANERMRAETGTVEISRASESRLITTKTLVNIEKGQAVLQEGRRIWSASLFSEDLGAKALLNHCCRPSWESSAHWTWGLERVYVWDWLIYWVFKILLVILVTLHLSQWIL